MALKDYTAKRQFDKTPEPGPGAEAATGQLRFVVQKHAARAVHYDLRLELGGVLKSWAVPRGPSMDPSRKRLAVMVEDHPLDYRDFEGVIPEGNYGAGSVIIWDRGIYRPAAASAENAEKPVREGLQKGDLKFVLEGEKLRGEFALVKMRKDGNSWLLLKKKDRYAGAGEILMRNRSVVSDKTLEEVLASGEGTLFRKKHAQRIRVREILESDGLKDAPEASLPRNIAPMLATSVREPFDHPDWLFEVKWDGYRAIAELSARGVSLHSRNGISFVDKFAPVAAALRKFEFEAVLDGEIVVVDQEGRPDFQALQHYRQAGPGRLLYSVFDLLYFEGRDLRGLSLLRRKELLKKILPLSSFVRPSDHVARDGVLFFRTALEKGLEGIVAKHIGSMYEAGKRSGQWLKIKARLTQDAVIAGFTEPGGGRKHIGALVLGVFDGDRLVYIGHVGSGFAESDLKDLYEKLLPFASTECPFPSEPATNAPVTWVRPELVCEVSLSGWTEDNVMRQSVFLRLREDKSARETVFEKSV